MPEIAQRCSIYLCAGYGWIFLPEYQKTNKTSFMDKTVARVLVEKHLPEIKPNCSTLEAYEEMLFFIMVDIPYDMVKLVAWKVSGSVGLSGMLTMLDTSNVRMMFPIV